MGKRIPGGRFATKRRMAPVGQTVAASTPDPAWRPGRCDLSSRGTDQEADHRDSALQTDRAGLIEIRGGLRCLRQVAAIRELESELGRPIAILADMQGPKLRIGTFPGGPVQLAAGQGFRLDLNARTGDGTGVTLPHPEIFAALEPDLDLLLDDGRIRLRVDRKSVV